MKRKTWHAVLFFACILAASILVAFVGVIDANDFILNH
jgi:hypothetical protein